MTVTVYVWLPRLNSLGHASMKLGNGTYISLWPAEDKTGKKKSQKKIRKGKKENHQERSESLEEDTDLEERDPDKVYRINGLDENAIQAWWDHFDERWRLLGQNCARTVIEGLKAGGSDRRLGFLSRVYHGVTVVWTPLRVATYCESL